MTIILGLGNPKENYRETKHNVGFVAVDKIREKYNFSDFLFSKKFNSLISEGKINKKKVLLIKPQTYMNASGIAVKKTLSYYKISPSSLYVFHDDIDIEIGKIKISKERGSAGHKGIESIFKEIKTRNFIRFRIGIGNIKNKKEKAISVVLKNFTENEKEIIKKTVEEFITKNLEENLN